MNINASMRNPYIRLTNTENSEEPPTDTVELQHKLTCSIDNENDPISFLQDGIKLSLAGSVTKNSPTLGRDALYLKNMSINKLVLDIITYSPDI